MGRKLQTIYEYFCDYSEKEIDEMIYSLSLEEKLVIRDRYGNDLHNPSTQKSWTQEKSKQFYGILVPKMKRLLQVSKKTVMKTDTEKSEIVSESKKEENNNIQILQPTILLSQLLQLIKEGKSNREICLNLNLTPQQLYMILLNLKNY